MRTAAIALLLAIASSAHASTSFTCEGDDASVKLTLAGAYGRGIGSGPGNFSGTAEIKLKGIPDHARKIEIEQRHLTMNWFHGRDLKFAIQWLRDGDAPSAEVILLIDMQRGKSEQSAYRGRYALKVFTPDGDGKAREAAGRVTCVTSD